MIRIILEKELHLTLLTFRFAACSLLLLLLMAASTGVLVLDWRNQIDRFEAAKELAESQVRKATAYAAVNLRIERRPHTLALVNQGIGDRFGRAVTVSGKYDVPRLSGGSSESFSSRNLLPIDFAHLVGILLSLVALVFTYDLVNGDRAQGTLQMTLASNVPRGKLLLAKYLGALCGLLTPFAGAVVVWLLVLQTATGAESNEFWQRIGVTLLLSVLYASIFLWVGLLASTLTARPSTALILSLLLWTLVVVIYPTTVAQIVAIFHPTSELIEEPAAPEKISRDEKLRARVEAARWEVVQRAAQQYRTAQALMRISPMASYDFATSALAGTDLDGYLAVLSAARRTDEALRAWQREKATKYPDREFTHINIPIPLDFSNFPAPHQPREDLLRTLQRILPDILLLVSWNLVLMIAAHVAFQRYDVRL